MPVLPGTASHVASRGDALQLGANLVNPQRRHPLVVIAVPKDALAPLFDADEVARQTIHRVDVFVVPHLFVDDLNARLPGDAGVYGAAARVYPPGAWRGRPDLARYFRVDAVTDGPDVQSQLIEEALRHAAGRPASSASSPPAAAGGFMKTTAPSVDGVLQVSTAADVDGLLRATSQIGSAKGRWSS